MINHTVNNTLVTNGLMDSKTKIIDPNILYNNRIVMGKKNDIHADIFRVLRTNILKQLRQNNWNSFGITSATIGAGKTFISVNLAIAIAMEGNQDVLLVDADLRRPNVSHYLGLYNKFGLVDCIKNDISLNDVCIYTGIKQFFVMPGKTSEITTSELIASQKMTELINEFKSRFKLGIVIFDLPPLFAADDTLLLMSHFDAALLVVEDGKNTTEELQQSMYILEDTNLLGLVLNKSTQPLPSYQYGY